MAEDNKSRDVWNVLENLAGTIEAPEDWSNEHNHYLYGTNKNGEVEPPKFCSQVLPGNESKKS